MKRSGRSVTEARRVIEIEEVLVARMALFLSFGQRSMKILRLTASSSVAASMTRSASPTACRSDAHADALQGRLHLRVGDDAARDLARHVALDGGARLVDRLLLQVVEGHVVAGERHHVGDAVAHLAGADDADRLDGGAAPGSLALAGALQLRAGFLRLDACVHDASLLNQPRLIHLPPRSYLPAFSSSAFSSGSTWNRSATSPKSATWKIGASPSLLMATMTLLSFMPARCWMAPEMPTAM